MEVTLVERALSERKETASVGIWTAIGTSLVLAVAALKTHGYQLLWAVADQLIHGDLQAARHGVSGMGALLSMMAAAVTIAVPAALLVGGVVISLFGKPESGSIIPWLPEPSNQFLAIMLLMIIEELYARWLFLGLLPRLPFLHGSTAFMVLFLVGNGTWALMHLSNYPKGHRKNLLRVMPQFLAGFFFTIAYVHFGLLGSLLVHTAYNMVIFSAQRRMRFGPGNFASIIYNAILLIIALIVLNKPIGDLTQWLHGGALHLSGWKFTDYLWAILLISAVMSLVSEVLCFDAFTSGDQQHGVIVEFIASIVVVGVMLLAFKLLGLFIHTPIVIVVIIALAGTMLSVKSVSGSSMARGFWLILPMMACEVCAMLAQHFWAAVALLSLVALVSGIETGLRRAIDEDF